MVNRVDRFPSLYYPKSAEELLTVPILEKLLLGFTTGLGAIPVALQDREKRYDLFGEPKKYWADFCVKLRKDFGLSSTCIEWDAKVARMLLGDEGEEYPGQLAEFQDLFECHAHMVDMAELIRVGGKPFAVLHGGQICPVKSKWEERMEGRLEKLEGLTAANITELITLVREDKESTLSEAEARQRLAQFKAFVREVEELLNKLYEHRRAGSEEALLKSLTAALAAVQAEDWPAWWAELSDVLSQTSKACGLSRMGFLMGESNSRFNVKVQAAGAMDNWGSGRTNIGPYWQVIRHRPIHVEEQSWAATFRRELGIAADEPCVVAADTVRETPGSNLPVILVCAGNEIRMPGVPELCRRLLEEVSRSVSGRSSWRELERMRHETVAFSAYVWHDIKSTLHAATNITAYVARLLKRLSVSDAQAHKKIARLQSVLGDVGKNAEPLERLPIEDMKVDCHLARVNVVPLIERAMDLARDIEPGRGITVKWVRYPGDEVLLDLDDAYLSTALTAILENAVKYSFDRKEVWMYAYAEGKVFIIEVSNYGVGIPPSKTLDIFTFGKRAEVEDEYKDRVREGAGLGLPIARSIITAHRGTIDIRSTPPKDVRPEEDTFRSHEVRVEIRLPLPSGED